MLVYIVSTNALQPFLTCGTLIKLAKFGGTPQQTMSGTTQKMQKTMLISKKKGFSVRKSLVSAIIEVVSKKKKEVFRPETYNNLLQVL